jgi:hypothetical protein
VRKNTTCELMEILESDSPKRIITNDESHEIIFLKL